MLFYFMLLMAICRDKTREREKGDKASWNLLTRTKRQKQRNSRSQSYESQRKTNFWMKRWVNWCIWREMVQDSPYSGVTCWTGWSELTLFHSLPSRWHQQDTNHSQFLVYFSQTTAKKLLLQLCLHLLPWREMKPALWLNFWPSTVWPRPVPQQ